MINEILHVPELVNTGAFLVIIFLKKCIILPLSEQTIIR